MVKVGFAKKYFIPLVVIATVLIGISLFISGGGRIRSVAENATQSDSETVTTVMPLDYHCFSDGSGYGSEVKEHHLDPNDAVEFTVKSGEGKMHNGWMTFPSAVTLRARALPTSSKIGSHTLSNDWAKSVDLSHMGYGDKSVSSIAGTADAVGRGVIVVCTENDDGEKSLQGFLPGFFKPSMNGDTPTDGIIPFKANGKYIVSLFFEAKGVGGNNHRIDIKFRIINTRSDQGHSNSIVIEDSANSGAYVPKNGATRNEFKVNFNDLHNLNVIYMYMSPTDEEGGGLVRNGQRFDAPGKYRFFQYLGPFDLGAFTITIDRRTPSASFGNIKAYPSGIPTCEGYVTVNWDAGNDSQWKIACEIYDRDTYTTESPGEMRGRDLSGSMKVEVPGRYKVVMRFDNSANLLAQGFEIATYDVDVEEYAKPSVNYEALTASRFNYIKTKWFELEYGGDIRCFYEYDRAFSYAMSIEDGIVNNEGEFRAYYCNKYSEINSLYNKYGGTHSAKISSIRRNTTDNIKLTAVMNERAEKRITENYFDCHDRTERVFEENSMFDRSHLYLDDTFQFVQKGAWETSTVHYVRPNGESGTIPYGVPVGQIGLPDGRYDITESDIYGNSTRYTVYRDISAPVVGIRLNDSRRIDATQTEYITDYFEISDHRDEYDPWAVLKVNGQYYLHGDYIPTFYDSGVYNIECYDRNKNKTNFAVVVRERELSVSLNADNRSNFYEAKNGGNFTVFNFSLEMRNARFPDVFYEFTVNGTEMPYHELNRTLTQFGVYSIDVRDKYSEEKISFGVRIAERELAPILVWDDNELTRIENNGRYTVNRFRIEYDDLYIRIDGNNKCGGYLSVGGVYELTAVDIYSGARLDFTVTVEERDISLAAKTDHNADVVLTGGEYTIVDQFKLERLSEDKLYYMSVKINGVAYDNRGMMFAEPGIYKIDVENIFNGKKYESVFVIEERPLELIYRINNDTWCVNGNSDGAIYNFIIDELPDYLDAYINNKALRSVDLPKRISVAGEYEIIIVDKFSAEQTRFGITLEKRSAPRIAVDGDAPSSVTEREYIVRRFAFTDMPEYTEITINGAIYNEVDGYITAAGVYTAEIRDIYAATCNTVTVVVDGTETDVVMIFDDNRRQKLADGESYDVYRFRINPLDAEKKAYTEISVNGVVYDFGGMITGFGKYVVAVKDLYKNTVETMNITITPRELDARLSSELGELDPTDGAVYDAAFLTVDSLPAHLLVEIDDEPVLAYTDAYTLYAFGEHTVGIIDRYNGRRLDFTIRIAERSDAPEITYDGGTVLRGEQGRNYYVYAFAIDALAHQEVTVNGAKIGHCEYTAAGEYNIVARDIYSGATTAFTVTVKNMTALPKLFADANDPSDIRDGGNISVYRFKLEYAEPFQSEYLDITVNGEKHVANGKYFIASGDYAVCIKNIFDGSKTTFGVTVRPRELYLPIEINGGKFIKATGAIRVLDHKLADTSEIAEYAAVSETRSSAAPNVYEYTVADRYSDAYITVSVTVTDISGIIGLDANKTIVDGTITLAIDEDIMTAEMRVDGRAVDAQEHGYRLTGDADGTHYYLRVTSKLDPTDVYEIYLIVRGVGK